MKTYKFFENKYWKFITDFLSIERFDKFSNEIQQIAEKTDNCRGNLIMKTDNNVEDLFDYEYLKIDLKEIENFLIPFQEKYWNDLEFSVNTERKLVKMERQWEIVWFFTILDF